MSSPQSVDDGEDWRIFSNQRLESALACAEIISPWIALGLLAMAIALEADISETEAIVTLGCMIAGGLYLLGDGVTRLDFIANSKSKKRK